MTRILFVSSQVWLPWGGSEELWYAAARQLRQRGIEVGVSVRWFGKTVPQIAELAGAGCRVHYQYRPSILSRGLRRITRGAMGQPPVDYLRQYDLVVISQGANFDGYPWMYECRRRDIPYAVVAQSAGELFVINDTSVERLAPLYEHAEMCFFVSRANLELTRKQMVTPLDRSKVIRNPFKIAYDAVLPWPADNGELRLACVARLHPPQKGQDLILDLLSLPQWRERPVSVSLVGEGDYESSLRRRAEQLELKSLRFSGFVEDITEVWRSHHALILPSRYEGMPLALVEAMLAGRPAIVTDAGGNAELVIDAETGFVAAAPTVEHLGEAVERAWDSRQRLAEMGIRAAGHIRTLVPPDPGAAFADEVIGILGRITSRNVDSSR